MTLSIKIVSIKYSGNDIGNDIRASFDVNSISSTKNFSLSPGNSWNPTAEWLIINEVNEPKSENESIKIGIKISERDLFVNDVGEGELIVIINKYSIVNKEMSKDFLVKEGDNVATFEVTFRVNCILKKFERLWLAHPSTKGISKPCLTNGKSNFDNQCAIRMGVAIQDAGISMGSYTGDYCWHNHGKKHTLRVEELEKWLRTQATTFGNPTDYISAKSTEFQSKVGIVAFINFWGTGSQGDHIDLWNGTIVRAGEANYFNRSSRVVFWQL